MSATFVFPSGRLPRFARNDNAVRVCALIKMIIRIKRRTRPNSMSFRGNGSDRGNLPEGETVVSATDDNFYNYSCTIVFVSPVGDFSAVSRRGQGRLARVCGLPFLLPGISRLTIEMTTVRLRLPLGGKLSRSD